jgi:hypothetical protein
VANSVLRQEVLVAKPAHQAMLASLSNKALFNVQLATLAMQVILPVLNAQREINALHRPRLLYVLQGATA